LLVHQGRISPFEKMGVSACVQFTGCIEQLVIRKKFALVCICFKWHYYNGIRSQIIYFCQTKISSFETVAWELIGKRVTSKSYRKEMWDLNNLKEKIMALGKQLGFKELKVIPAEPPPFFEAAMAQRVENDAEIKKAWLQKGIRQEPREVLPGALSLWVAIYPYTPYPQKFPSGMGTFSAHYRYYPEGREKMERLASILKEAGYLTAVNPLLPIKAIAYRAGLGSFGRNGLLIHPEYGSYMTFHILLTNAAFPYDQTVLPPQEFHYGCSNCDRCLRACPTAAIGEYGTVHLLKCLRQYMLSEEVVPEIFCNLMGLRILGCEICQRSCPENIKCGVNNSAPVKELTLFNIQQILLSHKNGTKAVTDRVAKLAGENYARAQRILSTAIIAAGNSGNPAYIPLLEETSNHSHPPIQMHSLWALAKLRRQTSDTNQGDLRE
jgi:epoxyqueuosine reductase